MLLSDGWSVHCPCATRLLALGINRPKSCLQLAGRMPCKQEMTLTIENRRQFTTKPAKNMQKPGKWYQMINDQANSSEDRFKSDLIGLYSNLILTPGTNHPRLPPRTSAQRFESLLLRQRPHTTSVILKLWSCLNKWALFIIQYSWVRWLLVVPVEQTFYAFYIPVCLQNVAVELTGWPCLNTGHVVLWCHKSGKTQAQKHLERPPKVVSCLIETSKWYISTIVYVKQVPLYPNWQRFFECIWCLHRFHNYNLKRNNCTIYHLKWFLPRCYII